MTKISASSTRRVSLADNAYDRLLQKIVRCELPPGAWYTVAQLTEELGLGRTPTTEALVRLGADRFVRPVKRRGWEIAPLTLAVVGDVIEAYRLVAPPMAVLSARNATDEQLCHIRELTLRWGPGLSPSEAGPDFDSAPFAYFTQICGNPLVAEAARGISAHFERVMNFALRQGSFVDTTYVRLRDRTLDALVARDAEQVLRVFPQLIDVGEAEVLRILQGTGSLRTVPLRLDGDDRLTG